MQLLEEGYTVVSVDASEPMVAQARNERQRRQNDPAFNNWGNNPMVHYMWRSTC